MAKSTNAPTLRGRLIYNMKDYDAPSDMSYAGMQDAFPNLQVTSLYLADLDGSPEAVNNLLDFSVEKIPIATGLKKL